MPSLRSSAALLALAALPCTARAQSTAADSLPFRAGQWAAEFVAGAGFGGAGLLRFHSPRAAWTVDLTGTASTERSRDETDASASTDVSATLRLGHRWYRPLGRATAAYAGGGLVGSLGVSHNERAGFRSSNDFQSAGAFGELGAAWFVRPQLSLGAASSLAVTARQQRLTSRPPTDDRVAFRSNGVNASLGTARLLLALYF